MSSNSLRLVAVVVALIVAVLTGAATGLLSGAPDCPAVTVTPGAQNGGQNSAPAGGGGAAKDVGDALNGGSTPKQQPEQQSTTPAGQPQAQTVPACTSQETFGFQPALVAFAGALFLGAALLLLLLLASRKAPAQSQTGQAGRGGPAAGGAADADRRALVQASIYVRDRVTSKALGDRLGAALAEAGVTVLEPVGVRFDPAHHEAGGTTPATDPSQVGQISAVEVPGYIDRDGRVLRAPIVTVYQAPRSAGGPTGAHQTVTQQPRKGQQR
ncbi:nucleotide exchange factor GrpE [Dactylosporangium sp. AC04546]|uniref:nucleotide exchange factor GrpE n=1 Tax=Dactylosporangium sp. AC04546 TaxID=2862460 RepID=UPI001EDF47DA|nr:nucleotide exchange factor GrpE [Dactylosporangium sp. AC04546]WVK78183.1 nucleotide exchange factor GrpE [Dactylosporangium sp. AC04546]